MTIHHGDCREVLATITGLTKAEAEAVCRVLQEEANNGKGS